MNKLREVIDLEFIMACVIVWLLREKFKFGWRQTIGVFILGIMGLSLLSNHLTFIYYDFVSIFPAAVMILFTYLFLKRDTEGKNIQQWESTNFPPISSYEFSTLLLNNCDTSQVRYHEDIPYNRAKYFSAGTEADIDMENVSNIFFDASPADNEMSFQEYGFLVTSLGVIVIKQIEIPGGGRKQTYDSQKSYLPFAGAYRFQTTGDSLKVYYANRTKKIVTLNPKELAFICDVFEYAIEYGWTYHVESVIGANAVTAEDLETIDKKLDDYYRRIDDLDVAVEKTKRNQKVKNANKQAIYASMAGSLGPIGSDLKQNQINDRFGKGQGHGHVGEQYGDVYDKLRFRNTEKLGSSHEKHGADRIAGGVNIQTKYHATAGKSIGQCFETNGGGAKYLNPDGSMMTIEVPRDQYDAALNKMAKRIEQGQVPNERNPQNADKYVKKGAITYEHSQIATKSIFDRKATITVRDGKGNVVRDSEGKIIYREVTLGEKLIWSAGGDFITGATAALPFGVVSGLWVYCNSVWQGKDKKTALKNSVISAAKPTLTGGVIYMVSSQFAGSQMGKATGNLLAKTFVKKQMSTKAKTRAVTKGTMGIITVAITVGPDLTDCLRGRLSMKQLVKNTVSTGVGMASGALAGGAVGSIVPVVGSAIGAVVGGSIGAISAKKIMDNFIEDDAIEMIRIAKEEFIETIMMSSLSEEEFNDILEKTFLSKKIDKLLKTMYASNNSREYIHEHFINFVEQVYLNRELPDEEEFMEVAMIHYGGLAIA